MIRQNILGEEGIKLVKENDGKYPSSSGKKLEDILKEIDMTIKEFDEIRKIYK